MAAFACSVLSVGLYWTILWGPCPIDRGDAGLEHWKEVRAEGIALGILHSGAKRERAQSGREGRRGKTGPRAGPVEPWGGTGGRQVTELGLVREEGDGEDISEASGGTF